MTIACLFDDSINYIISNYSQQLMHIIYNSCITNKQMLSEPTSFKKKHTLQERIQKSKKQMTENPGKLVIIVEKHKKSILPTLSNPRFLCGKDYKFSMIKSMIEKKVKQSGKVQLQGKNSFFIFVNGNLPHHQSTMAEIYQKYKDEDGFLYMQYGDQQSL